jgi:hypothetical protein
MSNSSIPNDLVDQSTHTDTFKLRQTEEGLQAAFQQQSEMYRTKKSCLCDCNNCIRARELKAGEVEESAKRRLSDIPNQPDSQVEIPDISPPLFRFPFPDIADIFSRK